MTHQAAADETQFRLADLSPMERFRAFTVLAAADAGAARPDGPSALRPLAPLSEVTVSSALAASEIDPADASQPSDVRWVISVLQALAAVDQMFEEDFGYRGHVYLLGDSSALRLTREVLPDQAQGIDGERSGVLLDCMMTLGLIYRFNVALKFGYPARGINQLRLNGWGRHLVQELGLTGHEAYRDGLGRCRRLFTNAASSYRELLDLCNADERPLKTARIAALNRSVPVPIVT